MSAPSTKVSSAPEPSSHDDALAAADAEVQRIHAKKDSLKKDLQQVEKRLFELEGAYLQDTQGLGNVVVGWDGYLNRTKAHQVHPIAVEHRIFSLTSISSPASTIILKEAKEREGPALKKKKQAHAVPLSTSAERAARRRESLDGVTVAIPATQSAQPVAPQQSDGADQRVDTTGVDSTVVSTELGEHADGDKQQDKLPTQSPMTDEDKSQHSEERGGDGNNEEIDGSKICSEDVIG